MQFHRRISANETRFIATGLDEREREAAHHLEWHDFEDGVSFAFPEGTNYLEEAFANFKAHAHELVWQRIDATRIPWQTALSRTLATICPLSLDWYLVGSAALAARGVDIVPGDIDLVTDAAGAYTLESTLHEHLVQPVKASPGWVAEYFGRAFLGASVEWAGAVSDAVDTPIPTDFGPVAASRLEPIRWNGYQIRVPPLDLQLTINRRRQRPERVEQIKQWMESQ